MFSFCSMAIVLLMAPMGIIGFFMYQIAHWGMNPWLFFAAFVLPHGLFELPAAILATAAALFFQNILVCFPITTQLSAWYSGVGLAGLLLLLGLTLYAFHTSLGGRPMFGARLLDD